MQILNDVTASQTINKSEFITLLRRCFSIDQAKEYVNQAMIDYPNANHYCYAYLIDNNHYSKSNDNGEPSGTAGSPILQALLKNNLDNVICIVIRYFGGIKLGASGLIRAYSSSALLAINKATLTTFKTVYQFKATFSYDNTGIMNNIITKYNMNTINIDYNDQCTYTLTSDNANYKDILIQAFSNNVSIQPLQDLIIEVEV